MQVHWYEYPVFAALRLFTDIACISRSGVALANMTEVNPLHQNDMWATALGPEGLLFSNPIAQISCIADAIASTAGYPITPMFWCVGAAGGLYPLSGNAPHYNSPQMGNMLIMAKSLAQAHKVGLAFQSIGPTATCIAHPNPIFVKSQYRLDPVGPIPRVVGSPIQFGKHELMWNFPPMNYPTGESSQYMIWQAKQCCLRP
jgi:conjugal transfer pilus assembly protein TraU